MLGQISGLKVETLAIIPQSPSDPATTARSGASPSPWGIMDFKGLHIRSSPVDSILDCGRAALVKPSLCLPPFSYDDLISLDTIQFPLKLGGGPPLDSMANGSGP